MARRAVAWEVAAGIYNFNNGAKESDVFDQLVARQAQLAAMLSVMAGASNDVTSFERLADDIKADYLWACESLTAECQGLTAALQDRALARARAGAIAAA